MTNKEIGQQLSVNLLEIVDSSFEHAIEDEILMAFRIVIQSAFTEMFFPPSDSDPMTKYKGKPLDARSRIAKDTISHVAAGLGMAKVMYEKYTQYYEWEKQLGMRIGIFHQEFPGLLPPPTSTPIHGPEYLIDVINGASGYLRHIRDSGEWRCRIMRWLLGQMFGQTMRSVVKGIAGLSWKELD